MLEIKQIEELTSVEDLSLVDLGESIVKFTGILNDQNIILRVFPKNDYYTNRFLREGAALRALAKAKDIWSDGSLESNIIVPEIIEEWSETKSGISIRALTWIHGQPIDNLSSDINPLLINNLENILYESQKFMPSEFSFERDFIEFLLKPGREDKQENSNWKKYSRIVEGILKKNYDWLKEQTHLIHGDFHSGNILQVAKSFNEHSESFAIIDWEFATVGSFFFDLAYAQVYSGLNLPKYWQSDVDKWHQIATVVLAHWYLINDPISRNAMYWLDLLEKSI